ncbi:CHAT domain-containing protein [Iningainema tapete]|uniref:CHAT domain-containing protein n=1 Tax=Iningainema tapete BLCC-T55 TaxID=2748662 RepID=A0A8J6XHT1_9CYAN|nr:CHAT domain-containing protein [Iningainema tapete]MBD2772932.1 CHAT domain-containing protein [Iningainema tapete BLCC-T55]
MNKIKLILLAFSTLSLFIVGLNLLRFTQKEEVKAVTPLVKSNTLPSSRLQPEVVKKFLDNQDINSAVIHVEQGWKQQYEEYVQRKLPSNQVFEVKKISQTLNNISQRVGKKSALIYAVPTPNHLELILVSPDRLPIHKRIPAAKKEVLVSLVTKFRTDIVNPDSQRSEYLSSGKKVYDLLIAPLESELRSQGINNLIFCLGGGLRTVPLAAIYDGEKFLVEKYSLGIIPAFNLLDFQPINITDTQVLAMGASEFKNLKPLPAVPLELSNIISNKWTGKSLLNQEFTLKNLKKERAIYPFGIVHLATHAELSPGSVKQSYIQFWDTQIRLDELKTLGLDNPTVQLLVLSACRTALGDPQAELGFAGLAVQSGAKAALASLWTVDDSGTLALMIQFYEKLKANPVKSEALRQAQIAMLKQQVSLKNNPIIRGSGSLAPQIVTNLDSQELSHPYYWAGFTLIGNPW